MYSTEEKHRYYLSFLESITSFRLLGLQKILSLTDDYISESFLNNLRAVVTRIDGSPSYLGRTCIYGDITLTQTTDREYKIDLPSGADVLESLFKIQFLFASRICFKLEKILYFNVCVLLE